MQIRRCVHNIFAARKRQNLRTICSNFLNRKLTTCKKGYLSIWPPYLFYHIKTALTYEGEQLYLRNIQRHEMGSYLCIASNGVPPSVSKRYYVDVRCKCIRALRGSNFLPFDRVARLIASFSLKSNR